MNIDNEKLMRQANVAIAIASNKSPDEILKIYDKIDEEKDMYVLYTAVCNQHYEQAFKLFELYKKKFPEYKRVCDEYVISLTTDIQERKLLLQMYAQLYGNTDFYNDNKL